MALEVTNFIHLKLPKMNKSFSLLFYVKSSKMSADGTAPIYLRVTIDGQRIELSSKRQAIPSKWNTSAQKLTGTGDYARSVNEYLKTLERLTRACECFATMVVFITYGRVRVQHTI
jgi:hypothetical protein